MTRTLSATGRRCALAALAAGALLAPPARAGELVFSSSRCASAEEAAAADAGSCPLRPWRVGDNGSGLAPLSGPTPPYAQQNPVFSPDLERIALLGSGDGTGLQLRVRPAVGGEGAAVGPRAAFTSPVAWSPDGGTLAASYEEPVSDGTVRARTLLAEADGSGSQPLPRAVGFDYGPSFTRDGRGVILSRWTDLAERRGTPMRFDLRTGAESPVMFGGLPSTLLPALGLARFSPSGRRLAYVSAGRLFTADAAGVLGRARVDAPEFTWVGDDALAFARWGRIMRVDLRGARTSRPRVLVADSPFLPAGARSGQEGPPEWTSGRPTREVRDSTPPVAVLVNRATGRSATSRRPLRVRRAALELVAFDPAALGPVEVSFSRRSDTGRFRRVTTQGSFGRMVRRLAPGGYRARVRVGDRRGNLRRRPLAVRLRLLP